jgi:hypothetical protein
MQLGMRQARYVGSKKTLFQLLMAATVANLTLVAGKMGQMRSRNGRGFSLSVAIFAFFRNIGVQVSIFLKMPSLIPALRLYF